MSTIRRNAGQIRLSRAAAAFVVLVCVAILALNGWREWTSRQAALTTAESNVSNLAESLTQHAQDTFELAEVLVIGLVNQLEAGGTGPGAMVRLEKAIKLRQVSLGRIHGLFVYDESGRWLATSEDVDPAAFNNADRDYFRQHRDSADKGTVIGMPVKSRSGGQWIITVSRRFDRPDGTFGGVVLASIDASYFAQYYEQFEVGPNGAISLLSASGIVLARSVNNETSINRNLANTPLFEELRSNTGRIFYYISPFDHVRRLSYYKPSPRFPVGVLAAEAVSDVLAEWREEAILRIAGVLALTALIAVLGSYLVRELDTRQRLVAALMASEADFRRLAEESSDMVMRVGFDETIRYVSPSCARVVGWTAEQLAGTPALASVNPEDAARVQETVEAVKRGERDEARMLYRTRHRTKGEIWLETAMHATRRSDTGEIDGVVAISRDMTEHKDLEQRLETLARLDGLTGLANRRRFDECLREEWQRAAREQAPLALLLIDVDYFKRYNDRYGHQAGDACLKAVAGVIASQARRPADRAARYGGEEFALLLPGTDAAGCEQAGERIREGLRALALPHAGNSTIGRVTVSLGGATGWPTTDRVGDRDPSSLVAAADRALYAAKRAGRDRLMMAGQVVPWPGAESA
ncbi:MAG: diguanylate cyclase [Alphaproteobacteria bacterium]|nr:diguanylate cyclase [Alphaproteobacteria bacterium]